MNATNLMPLDESADVRPFTLAHFPLIVGRGKEVDWRLEDRWVSRLHCRFEAEGDELFVADLGSKHGTYLNGVRVTRAKVSPGDRVSIGLCSYLVEVGDNGRAVACRATTAIPQTV